MSLTPAQAEAVAARGNVLVVAGAGTGKTHTLVERCLACLLEEQPPASLDEILVVTFTEAAAAEMRQRLRSRLEQELASPSRLQGAAALREQLALFETAHIGTLHSFCLELVRQHFYQLGLDPQLAVLAEEEARLLADETLEGVLQGHYAGRSAAAAAVQQLIQAQGRGGDPPIRALVQRIHHYTQTLPDPAGWFHNQLALLASSEPTLWQAWLLEAVAAWRAQWLARLEGLAAQNPIAAESSAVLRRLPPQPDRAAAAAALSRVLAASQQCPRGKKSQWLGPLEAFLDEASFLVSLMPAPAPTRDRREQQPTPGPSREGKESTTPDPARAANTGHPPAAAMRDGGGSFDPDPLIEDWSWVRSQMTTLLQLVQEFDLAFTEAKRELGMADFHDLEQCALRLLWDNQTRQPTPIARQWRSQLRFIFVDEYQDINAAQDRIIEALSRDGAHANRFLVGDVKQSIYRFRLADPHIFQDYVANWNGPPGRAIPLVDNFRSREGLLDFVNSLFGLVMRRELGGVEYDQAARLRFGAPDQRRALGAGASAAPRVELHLLLKAHPGAQAPDEDAPDGPTEVIDVEAVNLEARLVALRLRELKAQPHPVWDEAAKQFRPADWSDIAILLRAPARKAESYAKEFSRLNVPLLVARGGFYESTEISDLLCLLQLLDNPLQDLPALAVLHSPLVGLTANELAAIRLTTGGRFWTALTTWHQNANASVTAPAGTRDKVAAFLERFGRWRRLARQVSLSRCLETVLAETHYAEWLLTQPRGEQRHANVQRLLVLAQQFDLFQRQGLFRFLLFVEAQKAAETEPEVAAVGEENAVRLMSIHQSKGLEFPIVVVADLSKPFNLSDLRAEVILDEAYGLCPQIKPPHTGRRYPSLPYWLASKRQHRELLGEELRLLYVAMTRARDTLLLSAAITPARFEDFWRQAAGSSPDAVASARSCADWLGLWFSQQNDLNGHGATSGANSLLRWMLHEEARLMDAGADLPPAGGSLEPVLAADASTWSRLQQRLAWSYPFPAATRQPAKTSASLLRRAAAFADDEASPFPVIPRSTVGIQEARLSFRSSPASLALSGAAVGTAHHTFLQLFSLERAQNEVDLRAEARRLQGEGVLTAEQVAGLNFPALAGFWQSDVGRRILAHARDVRRELAFTARFSPQELAGLTGLPPEPGLEDEFVVVQGVADLVVLLPQEFWLLDFKTDAVTAPESAERARSYGPQVRLYRQALEKIYRRPASASWLYFLACQTLVPIP